MGVNQVNDWNPGIEPSGLFWTERIAPSAIDVDTRRGRARLRARNLPVPDFHNFENSISANPDSDPSHVSFDIRWHGGGDRTVIRNAEFGFRGEYVSGDVSVDFSARHDGSRVTYRSDSNDQVTVSGGVGTERNGVFFAHGGH